MPVILGFVLHHNRILSLETDDDSNPSSPVPPPTPAVNDIETTNTAPAPDDILTRFLARGGRPAQIRLSLTPQHPPIASSSTVLGD